MNLYAKGKNETGQFGFGDFADASEFKLLKNFGDVSGKKINAGGSAIVVADPASGTARVAGNNAALNVAGWPPAGYSNVQTFEYGPFADMSVGGSMSLFGYEDRTIAGVGRNDKGQLGDSNIYEDLIRPLFGGLKAVRFRTPILNIKNVTVIEAGNETSYIVANGVWLATGRNINGELGFDTGGNFSETFVEVQDVDDEIVQVSAASCGNIALAHDGDVVYAVGVGKVQALTVYNGGGVKSVSVEGYSLTGKHCAGILTVIGEVFVSFDGKQYSKAYQGNVKDIQATSEELYMLMFDGSVKVATVNGVSDVVTPVAFSALYGGHNYVLGVG